MSRKERRAIQKKTASEYKQLIKNEPTPLKQLEDKVESVVKDLSKILSHIQSLETKIILLSDTLQRKNIYLPSDISETENLYKQKAALKESQVKKILQENYTTKELLVLTIKDRNLPGYIRLDFDPILDFNVNPYEAAQLIKDENSTKTPEEQYKIGYALFKLTRAHFGL